MSDMLYENAKLKAHVAELRAALQHLTIPADDICQWVDALIDPRESISFDDKNRAAQCVVRAKAQIEIARAALDAAIDATNN